MIRKLLNFFNKKSDMAYVKGKGGIIGGNHYCTKDSVLSGEQQRTLFAEISEKIDSLRVGKISGEDILLMIHRKNHKR